MMKKELGLFTLLVVLCLAVCGVEFAQQLHNGASLATLRLPRFLSPENLTNLSQRVGMYGILAIGMGFIIITGGIDLSVGSVCALTGVLVSMALQDWHWSWPLAVLFILLISMLLGAAHGYLVTKKKIQPFIVTLCGMLIYRGLARSIAHESTRGFSGVENLSVLQFLASGSFLGVSMTFILLAVIAVVTWFLLHRSVYGRYLFAVGRNENATRFSGINTKLVIGSSYVVAGLLTGIAAIMCAFYSSSVSPSIHANMYEVYAIAAAVLGGCSLRGGEGSIIGIVIGAALLQVLRNLIIILGIENSYDSVVTGTVILIAVLVDQFFQERGEKKSRVRAAGH